MGQMSEQTRQKPLDDLTYDLVTVLHEKSKGLEAYDKYMRDAQGNSEACQLLEQIRQQDVQMIEKLRGLLARCIGGQQQAGMSQASPRGSVAGVNTTGSGNRSGAV